MRVALKTPAAGLTALPARARSRVQQRPLPVSKAASPARATRVVVRASDATPESLSELGAACSVDDMTNCSLADLEQMYVSALWSYYQDNGRFNLTNEQYDRLKDELNWQGSGFPTLRREEIKFVQASIEAIKGNSIIPDAEYDALKASIKSSATGKRADVTALLLCVKGQQMLEPEQYEELQLEMAKLGIDVGLKGAACTLSDTPENLVVDFVSLAIMYGGLAALPFLAATVVAFAADLVLPIEFTPLIYVSVIGAITLSLLTFIMSVAELTNPRIVNGQCPCCESKVNAFFGGSVPAAEETRKCQVCGTTVVLNREGMKLTLKDGPQFVQ